jgi:putative zinc finger/helix-turn-helix YgiT family protein
MKKVTTTICPECCEGTLTTQPIQLVGERNGEKFTVTVVGLGCDRCGYQTITNTQGGEFTKAVSDAYRQKHGLLTGDEIKELRSRLGMNQLQFAEYLGVGPASVKRWESGQIQEKGNDELIRLKADSERARANYKSLKDLLSGERGYTTVIFYGHDADLSTYSSQQYYPSLKVPMGVDMSNLEESLLQEQDSIAA